MSQIAPAIATVRPRVASGNSSDSRLLEEVIAELAEEMPCGVVRLVGPPGSGKSTSLAHLAAVFAHDERFVFLDEPIGGNPRKEYADFLAVVTSLKSEVRGPATLTLAQWGFDEIVEYLLDKHHDACSSVMGRLGSWARRSWLPQVATIVLDRFAANPAATDPTNELSQHVREQVWDPEGFATVCRYCLAILSGDSETLAKSVKDFRRLACHQQISSLVRHPPVAIPLAAERILASIEHGTIEDLSRALPYELIELVGQRCRNDAILIRRLQKTLQSRGSEPAHPMAASILHLADPAWKPTKRTWRRWPWQLQGAYFCQAQWANVRLPAAVLSNAVLSGATLAGAQMEGLQARGTQFDKANLRGAHLTCIQAPFANFSGAMLVEAKLQSASLTDADFTNADLTGATLAGANLADATFSLARVNRADFTKTYLRGTVWENANLTAAIFRHADLPRADLRSACLDGTDFESAVLKKAQMEDVRFTNAHLRQASLSGAYLTGSVMPSANLRDADLSGAHLAHIDWAGADLRNANLRGATFHMGSSRSGLVGSPIACEGSKTGFYTDDREEMYFKSPEEVRKANLCGADLRGANLADVDFYLVDLRGARLDPSQLEHVRQCGAILNDAIA